MDDDDLRRGRPTSHVVYGENVAILAGDGLFAEALRLLCERQGGPPERVVAALRELTKATGVTGMVGGQYIDVTDGGGDADGLRELHEMKTGRLIGASVGVALELTAPEPEAAAPYRRFAAELGVLFQIVDDILDVTGETADLGKPSGSDERHGKVTYVSLFGLDRARELAGESHAKARERSPRPTARPATSSGSPTSSRRASANRIRERWPLSPGPLDSGAIVRLVDFLNPSCSTKSMAPTTSRA